VIHALLTTLCLLQAADTRPYLGVSTSVHDEPVVAAGVGFRRGLRIDFVSPNSPAASAGLRGGDIIVVCDDVDFLDPPSELPAQFSAAISGRDVGDHLHLVVVRVVLDRAAYLGGLPVDPVAAWEDPSVALDGVPLGGRLDLVARRFAAILDVTVALQPRGAVVATHRPIPPVADDVDAALKPLAVQALADVLIDRANARADYAALRRRLARLVDAGDTFRLRRIAHVMREPFALAPVARAAADIPSDPAAAIRHAAACLDRPVAEMALPPLATGLMPAAHAEQIADLLTRAAALRDAAFAGLGAADRQRLADDLPAVMDSFREVVMVLVDPQEARRERVINWTHTAGHVDIERLFAAAVQLTPLLDPDYLAALRADLADSSADTIVTHDTPFGPVILANCGNNWHKRPAAVIIDLGGDDHYTAPAAGPFQIIIDLDGDDTYQATFDNTQAAATLGISFLDDHAGDDTYVGQHWAQAAAAVGVGLLHDHAGNDRYRANDYSQGAALVGIGLLFDDAGDDTYEAPRYAQGIGMPGGFGAIIDRAGSDHYVVGGRDQTNYGTTGVFDAFGQGCGIGFRGLASGGIGLLRDDGGDDLYRGDNFAQGGGYYFGCGILCDGGGDDRYLGARYAQAWAAHQALGFLEDRAGSDVYDAWRSVGQSCSWDETVTMLLDHAGDDTYAGPRGFARAAAHNNGWALLVDYAGTDDYADFGKTPRADGDDTVTSFALLLDLGGDEDVYAGGRANNAGHYAPRHGWFIDTPADLATLIADPTPILPR
jgi:hypothetical protein